MPNWVEPPLPEGEPLTQAAERQVGVGSAVDEGGLAGGRHHQDRVALPDVEREEVQPPIRARGQGETADQHQRRDCERQRPGEPRQQAARQRHLVVRAGDGVRDGCQAAVRQDPPTRYSLFVHARWQNVVPRLDLAGFLRFNVADHSRLAWLEARYRYTSADLALQLQRLEAVLGADEEGGDRRLRARRQRGRRRAHHQAALGLL